MGSIDIEKLVTAVVNPEVVKDANLSINPQTAFYNAIYVFLWVIALVAVGMIIYGGFTYITSAGDAEKAVKGRKIIFGAAIGIILIMLSLVFYNTIMGALYGSSV